MKTNELMPVTVDMLEQKVVTEAWHALESLKSALHESAALIKFTGELYPNVPCSKVLLTKEPHIWHALVILKEALAEARKTNLYSILAKYAAALDIEFAESPSSNLMALDATVNKDLAADQEISAAIFFSMHRLFDILEKLDAAKFLAIALDKDIKLSAPGMDLIRKLDTVSN